MSADEEPSVARQLGQLRALTGAAALGAIGSLAGCSTEPGTESATTDASVETEVIEGSVNTRPNDAEPDPDAPTTASTAVTTLSSAECRDRVSALEAELAAVREEIDAYDAGRPALRQRHESLATVARLYDPPAAEVVQQAEAVGQVARDAVVFLEFPNGAATGWYVDDHDIITNAHNVYDRFSGEQRTATVWTLDGDAFESTTVDFVESALPDVALIRTEAEAPATLPIGTTPDNGSEEPLVQVGHPGGLGNWVVTLGTLRDVQVLQTEDGTLLTELLSLVPGRQGVSGSPVLNLDGEVVGLTYAGTDVQRRRAGEPPVVAEATVYDRPIAALSYGTHWGIDTVMSYYEEWH